ncbi:MAG: NAD(FAD)-utilizing dehydrogenase [Firmicutes bacterium]|nr:NAD(FAD)-utilizing dehydrogenase [Bacillota bacterium]
MYRIHQIKLNLNENKDRIPGKVLKKIGGRDLSITKWNIVKESLDARDKSNIMWTYSVDFELNKSVSGGALAKMKKAGVEEAPDLTYNVTEVELGQQDRPVVVGFGPGGIFAGLILAQAGLKPIVLERGQDVDTRTAQVEKFWNEGVLDTESNVQFGEGGAGAFSDGKLTTGIKDVRIKKVLEEFVRFGAPAEILYKQKPHIGTDILRVVVKNIREEIIRLGGEVRFGCKMTSFEAADGCVKKVHVVKTTKKYVEKAENSVVNTTEAFEEAYEIPTSNLILAIGHSARDTFRFLAQNEIKMEQKPFSIGVRIEHPQEIIDIAQYGKPGKEVNLPPAEYKINYRCKEGIAEGRGVYSFCMCPGGQVILASSQEEGVVVNGMSLHARDSGTANSALLCDVRTEDFGSDDILAGVVFQEKYEKAAFINAGKIYKAPTSTWGELRDGHAPQVENSLPEFAVAALKEAMPHLGRKLKGFDADDAKVSAVETRSSSPVRILRGKDGESLSLRGLYPCGEGAGYAGGITSAAVDGIKMAEAVIEKYK